MARNPELAALGAYAQTAAYAARVQALEAEELTT